MWILAVSGLAMGGARPVTPDYAGNCQSPVWAKDGSKLAYEVNFHDRKVIELYVYEPGKGTERRVMPVDRGQSSLTAGFQVSGLESVAHEVSWAPASIGRFVYSASSDGRDYDLFIDGSGAIAKGPGTDGSPTWSPNGRYIAFTSARSGEGDVYLVDVNAIEEAPRAITGKPDTSELYISWAPNSKSLAYVSHSRQGDNVFVVDTIDAPQSRRLTFWEGTQTRPTWSPDGKTIAYYANHEDPARFDLHVVAAAGGEPTRIASGVVMNARGPSWTPDGTALVYVQDDDASYDPVWLARVAAPASAKRILSDTVGNGDIDVVKGTDGKTYVAVAAQGLGGDQVRDFKRIYVLQLP